MSSRSAEERLDALGLECPQPVFRARARLETMEPGDMLAVLADDPLAELDLRVFCDQTGHEFVGCRSEADHQVIRIRKRGG
ncbi:MAG: sulfurtransferase TusA family protein [Candidatus Wenzhouxiangella sp. M2_3B_020]